MVFDPSWAEAAVGRPPGPTEPLRLVFEALGSRLGDLETRARLAEERAERAEANYSAISVRLRDEQTTNEQLTRERDAAKSDYYTRRRSADELEKRISDAVSVLDEHPRSGAKAAAILRGDEAGPE